MEKNKEWLYNRRKELNLTQQELAKKLDVAGNYIYMLESGKKPITKKIVNKLEQIFPVETHQISHGASEVPKTTFDKVETRLSTIEQLLLKILENLQK